MILQNVSEIQKRTREFEKSNSTTLTAQNFTVLNQICSNQASKFYKVVLKSNKKPFALRVTAKAKTAATPKQREQVQKELLALLRFPQHPGLVRTEAVFEDKSHLYVLLEAVDNNLLNLTKSGTRIAEPACRGYLAALLKALAFLHGQAPPIIHRNIRPENIFISGAEFRLFGFDLAVPAEDFRNTICGSYNYSSPEMLNSDGYDEKADLWSVGVLAFELLNARHPYLSNSMVEDSRLNQSFIEKAIGNSKLAFEPAVSKDARALVEELLSAAPFKRPSAAEALEHEFFGARQKDNSFTVNFDAARSKAEESLEWSVTQSYIISKPDKPEMAELVTSEQQEAPANNLFFTDVQQKSKNSFTFNGRRPTERSPFEILLEQHHKIHEQNITLRKQLEGLRADFEQVSAENKDLLQSNAVLAKSNSELIGQSQVSRSLDSSNQTLEKLSAECHGFKRLSAELEVERQAMGKEVGLLSASIRSLKEKLATAEQNLSYMFKKSKQLSDVINDFLAANFIENYQQPPEYSTVTYDKLIQQVEFVFGEYLTLRKRADAPSTPQSSLNFQSVVTRKPNLGASFTEKSSAQEPSQLRTPVTTNSNSNKTLHPLAPKDGPAQPPNYKSLLAPILPPKYPTERLVATVSAFAKPQFRNAKLQK